MILEKSRILPLIFILFSSLQIFSQSNSFTKYDEMLNAFILGLDEKGLEICHEIISNEKYSLERGSTIFFVGDYFLKKALDEEEVSEYVSRAFTLYKLYEQDYPNGEFIKAVKSRIILLSSLYSNSLELQNLLSKYMGDKYIVKSKLDFAVNGLLQFQKPIPYLFFLDRDSEQSPTEVVNKYLDDIIINYPEFEIYSYYYKIISKISLLSDFNFIKSGILPYDEVEVKKRESVGGGFSSEYVSIRNEISQILDIISKKYPHNPITLDLHLIVANVFKPDDTEGLDSKTLEHLEFVLKNEEDELSLRYLLAKEYILINKLEVKNYEKNKSKIDYDKKIKIEKKEANKTVEYFDENGNKIRKENIPSGSSLIYLVDNTVIIGNILSQEKVNGKSIRISIKDEKGEIRVINFQDIKKIETLK